MQNREEVPAPQSTAQWTPCQCQERDAAVLNTGLYWLVVICSTGLKD